MSLFKLSLWNRFPVFFKETTCWRYIHFDTSLLRECKVPNSCILTSFQAAKQFECHNLVRQMAGHAKWQNIKHIKAEKDRVKSLMCSRYYRLVLCAVREKGPDPKLNSKLASLLEEAKKNNVPMASMEKAMKSGINKKLISGSMEIYGPGGSYIIVEYETDNISTIRHDLKVLCKKHRVNIVSGDGKWRSAYEEKGFIKAVKQLNGEPFNEEKSLDDAILAGAEEVLTQMDENDKPFLEFVCAPEDLHTAKKELEQYYEVEEAYVGFKPMVMVQLSDEDMSVADKFLEEVENLHEVTRIYENVQ